MNEKPNHSILLFQSKEYLDDNYAQWEACYDIRDIEDKRHIKLAEYYRSRPKEYRNVRLFEAVEIKEGE